MNPAALFQTAPEARRRRRSRVLALRDPGCPECGHSLAEHTVDQPALLVHGGYGATRRTTWSICANRDCRYAHQRAVDEVRPEQRPPRIA